MTRLTTYLGEVWNKDDGEDISEVENLKRMTVVRSPVSSVGPQENAEIDPVGQQRDGLLILLSPERVEVGTDGDGEEAAESSQDGSETQPVDHQKEGRLVSLSPEVLEGQSKESGEDAG